MTNLHSPLYIEERMENMISLLIVIGILALMFKATGFCFRLCGKLLGIMFSVIGYLFLGGLSVGVFGIALFIIPVIVIAGITSICVAMFG